LATQAQIDANRANAQNSTGPRTPEGRGAVRLNGLRHGLRAETAVLPDEDPAEFEQLKDQLEAELQPIGAQETLLFEDIVLAAWRLRRARAYDTAVTARLYRGARKHLINQRVDPEPMRCFGLFLHEDAEGKKVLDYVARIEGRYRRTYHQALKELRQLQAMRPPAQTIARPQPEPPPELALVAHSAQASTSQARPQASASVATPPEAHLTAVAPTSVATPLCPGSSS
jgi:hypothetical protein